MSEQNDEDERHIQQRLRDLESAIMGTRLRPGFVRLTKLRLEELFRLVEIAKEDS